MSSLFHRVECGFSAVFILLRAALFFAFIGAAATALGWALKQLSPIITLILGLTIITAGLVSLGIGLVGFIRWSKAPRRRRKPLGRRLRQVASATVGGFAANRRGLVRVGLMLLGWAGANTLAIGLTGDTMPLRGILVCLAAVLAVELVLAFVTFIGWDMVDDRFFPTKGQRWWSSLAAASLWLWAFIAGLAATPAAAGWQHWIMAGGMLLLIPLGLGSIFQCSEPSLLARTFGRNRPEEY